MMNNWKNEFFLARGLVLHRQSGGILEFFDALEEVLNQSTLNSLIIALCDILRTEFKVRFKAVILHLSLVHKYRFRNSARYCFVLENRKSG